MKRIPFELLFRWWKTAFKDLKQRNVLFYSLCFQKIGGHERAARCFKSLEAESSFPKLLSRARMRRNAGEPLDKSFGKDVHHLNSFSFKNQRGIAMMLVLSTLVLLTAFSVEFAYDTNIVSHLALNDKQRLQAEFLARSSYNFMLLELMYDKVFRQAVQKNNLAQFLSGDINSPLCKQFPISTGMLKFFVLGEGTGVGGEEGEDATEKSKMVSLSQAESAKDFLDFAGDFDGECIPEGTKINLNAFASLNPDATKGPDGMNEYERYMSTVISFLKQPAFEKLFLDYDYRIEEIVSNIANWIDKNDVMNTPTGSSSASELGAYEKIGAKYKIRNNKALSKDELYLIPGVDDRWFQPLKNYFTIYGSDKMNLCTAEDMVIASQLAAFFSKQPDLSGIKYNQKDVMEKFVTAVHDGCAQGGDDATLKANIAKSIWAVVSQYVTSGTLSQNILNPFTESISTESNFYTLINTGQVGNTTVKVEAVVNITDSDPKKWGLVYWRVY